eukprot:742962-Hanusia_phi.AAC.3
MMNSIVHTVSELLAIYSDAAEGPYRSSALYGSGGLPRVEVSLMPDVYQVVHRFGAEAGSRNRSQRGMATRPQHGEPPRCVLVRD